MKGGHLRSVYLQLLDIKGVYIKRQCEGGSPALSLSAAPRYPPYIRGAGLLPSSPSVTGVVAVRGLVLLEGRYYETVSRGVASGLVLLEGRYYEAMSHESGLFV